MLVTSPALVISTPALRYLQLGTPHAVKHVTPTTTGVFYPSIPSHPTQHARGIAHPTSSYQVHFTPLYTYNYKYNSPHNTIQYYTKQPPLTGSHGHPRPPTKTPRETHGTSTEHPSPQNPLIAIQRSRVSQNYALNTARNCTQYSTVRAFPGTDTTRRRSAVMHPPSLRGG